MKTMFLALNYEINIKIILILNQLPLLAFKKQILQQSWKRY